eukprot:scaffold230294_cov38-Prasinocladus_malaysianus.AAC.1
MGTDLRACRATRVADGRLPLMGRDVGSVEERVAGRERGAKGRPAWAGGRRWPAPGRRGGRALRGLRRLGGRQPLRPRLPDGMPVGK